MVSLESRESEVEGDQGQTTHSTKHNRTPVGVPLFVARGDNPGVVCTGGDNPGLFIPG